MNLRNYSKKRRMSTRYYLGKNNIQLWQEDLDDISKIFNTPVKKVFNVKKKN